MIPKAKPATRVLSAKKAGAEANGRSRKRKKKMLGTQSPSSPAPGILMEGFDQARHPRRKRKAESQDNERLSKRLSLLNIGECDLLIC